MPTKSRELRAVHNRRYYENGGAAKIRASNAEKRKRNRQYIDSLKSGPCLDCGGEFPPVAMDFDHVSGTKKCDVAKMVNGCSSLEAIDAEVAKCELVCANCHRIRTHYRRAGVA